MNNALIILLAEVAVIINGMVDHFFPPVGIFATPCVLPVSAGLIWLATKGINPIFKSIYTFGCVVLNDLLIKLYGGGTHDVEGMGWVNLFLLVGLIPVFGLLVAATFTIDKQRSLFSKIAALAIFPAFVAVYLYYFSALGVESDIHF